MMSPQRTSTVSSRLARPEPRDIEVPILDDDLAIGLECALPELQIDSWMQDGDPETMRGFS